LIQRPKALVQSQCAAPFPSTPARSALNQIRRFRAQAPPSKGRQKNESGELYDCHWQDRRHPLRDRYYRRGCVGICQCCLGANRVCALRQLLPHRTIDANHDAFDGGALLSVTERNQRIEVIGCNRPSTRYHRVLLRLDGDACADRSCKSVRGSLQSISKCRGEACRDFSKPEASSVRRDSFGASSRLRAHTRLNSRVLQRLDLN
jgi:hypothetical protein